MSTAIPHTFRAALIDKAQAPIRIGTTSLASPALSPDELGIRITATAINPADWKIRESGMLIQSWPAVLGSDAAGVVVEVGTNFTSKFQPGDRVFFQGILGKNDSSTFQEYTRIPAHTVGKTPASITDEAAAGLSLGSVTAAVGLYHKTGRALSPGPWDATGGGNKVGEGKAIVVLGGSTSVGQYVIQLARLSGYTRIVTGAGAAHAEFLKGLGAHVVLDRQTHDGWQDYVDAVGPGVQLDLVYDAIAADHAQLKGVQIIRALGDRAAAEALVVTVLQAEDEAVAAGRGDGGGEREIQVHFIMAAGYWPDYRYVSEPMYEKFSEWLASGELVPNRVQVVPGGLEGVEEALQLNKAGVSGVKVIVKL
ncbi:NADPH:quinone reductase [Microdochium nivale]|nr:NADPH:quinone reductase [Microdochium nivale]